MTADVAARVVIYGTRFCPYCMRARELLDYKGVEYRDVGVDHDPALRREMEVRSGRRTVPQIFVDGEHLGGYDDLHALELEGKLDPLLFPLTMLRGRRSAGSSPDLEEK